MTSRFLPIDQARRWLAAAMADLCSVDAEWQAGGVRDSRRDPHRGAFSALHVAQLGAYLAIQGAMTERDFRVSTEMAIDRAVALDDRAPGLPDAALWLELGAVAGRLDRLTRIRWRLGPEFDAERCLADWWTGVAMGDWEACRAARARLRCPQPSLARAQAWRPRRPILWQILDALDGGDQAGVARALSRLLVEHDEAAYPDPRGAGRLSRTPAAALACWPAMAFIAEARRRRLRVDIDSPYLTPGFRVGGGLAPRVVVPRRSRACGPSFNQEHARAWLRSIERDVRSVAGGARAPDDWSDGWDYVAEVALRRVDLWAGLTALDEAEPANACAAHAAMGDVSQFVTKADRQFAEVGRGGAPSWLLALGLEVALVAQRGAPAGEPVAERPHDGPDAAFIAALDALSRREDARATDATSRLRRLPAAGDDVPHARRFPPSVVADAIDATASLDAPAFEAALRTLLSWHDEQAAPRPRGRKLAMTPELLKVSMTSLALLAVARCRGLDVRVESPYVPASLLLHDCGHLRRVREKQRP